MNQLDSVRLKQLATAVLDTEADAINALRERIDSSFVQACEFMFHCSGRIVVLGMGKSGHVGGKIAATLASTGTPAFFVHPGEASHGDLGMITNKDVVLALSNSGETDEILTIVPLIKRLGVPLVAMTGSPSSTLATEATVHLDIGVPKEACPLGLAPTESTTATLAMGDALAVSLLETRGFTAEDFARSHPGGRLGRRLLLHCADVMRTGEAIPRTRISDTLDQALMEMSRKGMGFTIVLEGESALCGVFTDGDLRRVLDSEAKIRQTLIADIMTRECASVPPEMLAAEALGLMEGRRINALPVVDEHGALVGALNMHDLLKAGVA
jgi:arabinose-5-phosphate isomerase